MGYALTRAERETVLLISEADDRWTLTSCSPAVIQKLERLGFRGEKLDKFGTHRFVLPAGAVSFRKPRQATPAQLAALEKARAAK